MLDEILNLIMQEPTEEENQMADILQPICVQEFYSFQDRIHALQYFNHIEPGLIISKINVAVTPLQPEAMFYVH